MANIDTMSAQDTSLLEVLKDISASLKNLEAHLIPRPAAQVVPGGLGVSQNSALSIKSPSPSRKSDDHEKAEPEPEPEAKHRGKAKLIHSEVMEDRLRARAKSTPSETMYYMVDENTVKLMTGHGQYQEVILETPRPELISKTFPEMVSHSGWRYCS